MKKGISLIVLVITIIVMIIIAGAIIISLNSSNVIDNANTAVDKSNEANAKSVLALKYSEVLSTWYGAHPTETYIPNATDLVDIKAAVEEGDSGYTVVIGSDGYVVTPQQ